jgi:hypothetical protein
MLVGLNNSAHNPINIANTINRITKNKASLLINLTVLFIFSSFSIFKSKQKTLKRYLGYFNTFKNHTL